MQHIQKQYIVVGLVIFALLGVGIFFYVSKSGSNAKTAEKKSVFEQPEEVIPTVDSSVEVSITGNKEAVISVSGIPQDTTTIDYELSYNTESGSIEGSFGKIDVDGSEAEEKVTFGTCSSGVCRYHLISGPVKGSFKFTGSYGERILEKTFDL